MDVKTLGRIPDGGGWRAHGRGSDGHRASQRQPRPGYVFLHSAVDDRSRLAYTEELTDEKAVIAAGFWQRAVAFFAAHGFDRIHRVLTDNGSCYRSNDFNVALGRTVLKYTRPYRPHTNGKAERYQRTLAREWAYRQAWSSNDERTAALAGFLHRYNYHRAAHRTGRTTTDLPHPDRHQPAWVQHLDICSRRVVGWSLHSSLNAALVTNALGMDIDNRGDVAGTVIHPDQGARSRSWVFNRTREGIRAGWGAR